MQSNLLTCERTSTLMQNQAPERYVPERRHDRPRNPGVTFQPSSALSPGMRMISDRCASVPATDKVACRLLGAQAGDRL